MDISGVNDTVIVPDKDIDHNGTSILSDLDLYNKMT